MRQLFLALFLAFFGLAPVGDAWAETVQQVTGNSPVLLAQKKKRKKKKRKKKKKKKKKKRKKKRKKKKKKKKAKAEQESPKAASDADEAGTKEEDAEAKPSAETPGTTSEKAKPAAKATPEAGTVPAVVEAAPEVPKGWWASRSDIGKYTVLGGSGAAVAGLGLLGLSAMQANGAVDRRTELQGMPNWDDGQRTEFFELEGTQATWAVMHTVSIGLASLGSIAAIVGSFL